MSADNGHVYLGDSVYAQTTGDGTVVLRLEDHRSKPVAYLEPEVIKALVMVHLASCPSARETFRALLNNLPPVL